MKLFLSIFLGALLLVTAGVPAVAQEGSTSAEQVFTAHDKDRDGKLSQSEFAPLLDPSSTEEQKKAMFAKWDADSDGYISKEEFTANYRGGGSGGEGERKRK